MLWLFRGQLWLCPQRWLLLLWRAAAAPSLLSAANSLNFMFKDRGTGSKRGPFLPLAGDSVGVVVGGRSGLLWPSSPLGERLGRSSPAADPHQAVGHPVGLFLLFWKAGGGSKESFPPYLAQEYIGRFPGGPPSPTWCPPSMSGFQSSLCRPAGSPPGPGPTVGAQSTLSRLVPPPTWRGPPGCSDPALGTLPRAAGLSAQGSPRPTRIPPPVRSDWGQASRPPSAQPPPAPGRCTDGASV